MSDQITDISAVLLKEYLFQGLDVEQAKYIASKFRTVRYHPDQTVIYEDMPPLNFYIVYKGSVQISAIIKRLFQPSQKVKLYTFGPGNFFGEEALLNDQNNKNLVKTTEESVLLIMDKETFDSILEQFPEVEKKLKVISESRSLARSKHYQWFDGEALHLMGRKHWFFLIRSLILPIFLFIFSIPAILYTFTQLDPSAVSSLFQIGSILLMIGAVALAIWNWVDWGNDYYIVTTQRVIWVEKVVALYDNRNEAPLYTILKVDVATSQLGRILGYGNVATRTYTGTINMNKVAKAADLAAIIEGLIKRQLQMAKATELSQIQGDVQKAIGREDPIGPDLEELVIKPPAEAKTIEEKRLPISERFQHILKVRYEQDGVITYRKHWYLLFQKTWLPLLMIVIFIFALYFIVPATLTESAGVSGWVVFFGVLVFCGLIAWLVYSYVDWRNDIYQLTPEQIFQIYRKPLGSELKSSASIENILTINHERENLTGILLNFGTVTVSVGDTEIIFAGVFNPDQVHQDIADYQEALKRRKSKQKTEDDRKTMVNWLMTYDQEAAKRASEGISPEVD
jgi:uncharacterized membrane protein YdbT with pleckstrin-like domain